MFDSIISTLKLDNATVFKQDPTTGMAIYSNDGMRFEYPVKFDTDYAFLTVGTSVEKAVGSKSDTCDPTANALTINGIKFCSTTSGDVGAGQLYTIYAYTTVHGGNTYTISYSVQSSNGCGAYQNSPNLNSPENQRYNECLDFKKNYASIVTEPLKQSISTFTFTN